MNQEMKFKIQSINISAKKGELKLPVKAAVLNSEGIAKDAHRGDWHRQVSLLAQEEIEKFSAKFGQDFNYGEFAENITTLGIDFRKTKVLDILENENVSLMITQKGKKCHGGDCAVFQQVGHCVMPKEGIFAKVIKPGKIKLEDELEYKPKVFKIAVITLSDRASRGEYEDLSGPAIQKMTEEYFASIDRICKCEKLIIPDDAVKLKNTILHCANAYDVIFTTGGTGVSQKDITIETITPILDKQIPGIMEMVRMKYGQQNPNALLSRSVAGTISKTLVFCMPGSPKAVKEYMTEIATVLEHLIYMTYGFDNH